MNIIQRIGGKQGVLAIVGSGFHWAWFDALFMSAMFVGERPFDPMPEVATVLVFACCVPFCLIALAKSALVERLINNRRNIVAFAVLGAVGSLLFVFAGVHRLWAVLVIGGVLGGTYMGFAQLGWCASYSHRGVRTATPLVSGAFACAVALDIVPLLMVPLASAVLFALFPLASGLLFLALDPTHRTYCKLEKTPSAHVRKPRFNLRSPLGISVVLLGALMLVFVCFGYLQHLMSFMTMPNAEDNNGTLIQMLRGGVAVLLFAVLVLQREARGGVIYRVGLLAMVAGCLLMPFFVGTEQFWVSGAFIIAGFTVFDVLIYVVFSQVAYAESEVPIKTIAVMRLLTCVSYCVGAVCAIGLTGAGEQVSPFFSQEATLVGFLMTIATVLLLSSDDIWVVLGAQGYRVGGAGGGEGSADAGPGARFEDCFDGFGLTAREADVAELLIVGHTQARIAETLCISDNTVATHVRHVYQKVGVHNRQQFIDFVSPAISVSLKINEVPRPGQEET